jgi:hypothetical protein
MPHCQICLCPAPHHAVNCPVGLGTPQGGTPHFQPGPLDYYRQDYYQPQMGSGGGLADHMRIERLEKELAALAARVAKLERER